MHSQDVVDTTDAKTFTKKSKFCLRVLAQYSGRELVRDELAARVPQRLRPCCFQRPL